MEKFCKQSGFFYFNILCLLTSKKSKKGVDLTSSPYFSGSFLKKNIWVSAASTSCGSFLDMTTRSSRSWRLSRPLQKAFSVLFSHATLVAWMDRVSRVTLDINRMYFPIFSLQWKFWTSQNSECSELLRLGQRKLQSTYMSNEFLKSEKITPIILI